MKAFEYKVGFCSAKLSKDIEKFLNSFGQDGWELVSVSGKHYHFKREVSSKKETWNDKLCDKEDEDPIIVGDFFADLIEAAGIGRSDPEKSEWEEEEIE